MILVRMAEYQGVHVTATVGVLREALTQVCGYVTSAVIRVISGQAYFGIDKNCLPAGKLEEGHVPVIDGEESDLCRHFLSLK
jgi:hypothetical protein